MSPNLFAQTKTWRTVVSIISFVDMVKMKTPFEILSHLKIIWRHLATINDCLCDLFDTIIQGLRTPRESFFPKLETYGLRQTNWAGILWGIWGISGQTISTNLALWVPCPWRNVAGPLTYKKLLFLGLKHITPKCSQNKIWAVKNLKNSVHTSVFIILMLNHEVFSQNLIKKVLLDLKG